MHAIKKMIDKLEKEIEKYAEKNELTPQEWDVMHKHSETLKNFACGYKDMTTAQAMEEYGSDYYDAEDREGTSGRHRMAYPYYYRDNSYGTRNRGDESMMRGNSNGNSYGNSYNNGGRSYSNGDTFQSKARELMDYATNDDERRMAQNMLSSMQNRY